MRRLDAYNYPEREAALTGVLERGPHRNTTGLSIEDMETMREQLGIEQWVVAGGSWGSILSIAYAETHPGRTRALLLLCMWLGDPKSLDFWFDCGRHILPECYEQVVAGMSDAKQRHPGRTPWGRASRLADIPVIIRQGRFDMCTPPSTVFAFHAAVPHADLRIVENASHMPTEHNLLREIVRAGDELHALLTHREGR